jgi:two-component system LytT family sensor kinase
LTLVISNPIDLDVKSQKGTGFGLSSIKRRLFLLYGRADLLTTSQSDTTFSATLKIPQKND